MGRGRMIFIQKRIVNIRDLPFWIMAVLSHGLSCMCEIPYSFRKKSESCNRILMSGQLHFFNRLGLLMAILCRRCINFARDLYHHLDGY